MNIIKTIKTSERPNIICSKKIGSDKINKEKKCGDITKLSQLR